MIPQRVSIFVATRPIDLRLSFDRLAAAVRDQLGEDPVSGALFLFFSRRRDRVKLLWWDRTGFCLLYKRLESGLFRIPEAVMQGDRNVSIDIVELTRILAGINLPLDKLAVRAA